jgi:hypothetical protein
LCIIPPGEFEALLTGADSGHVEALLCAFMAGLVPAIHALRAETRVKKDMDARDKRGMTS